MEEDGKGHVSDTAFLSVAYLRKLCRHHKVPLLTALSLRRHHIQNYNKYKTMPALGLGQYDDINRSAQLLEEAVEDCLRNAHGIALWSESEQKAHIAQYQRDHPKDKGAFPPTPDFILQHPVRVQKYAYEHDPQNGAHRKKEQKRRRVIVEERVISWLEVKMFYGASTIDLDDGKSAVGKVVATARKYVRVHGDGAMLFLYGCGDQLADRLRQEGVIVLDGSAHEENQLSLEQVQQHQRTWCADAHGNILP